MDTTAAPPSRLAHFPIAFFAMVMGLAGLTIAWQQVQRAWQVDLHIDLVLLALTTSVFLVLAASYLTKLVRHFPQVRDELRHPVKINFFPTVSISIVLLSIAAHPLAPEISRPMWQIGAALHLVFTLYIVNAWMHHSQATIQHLNPAWFIPAVGNVLVPIVGVPLGYFEISWLYFSIGMLFWLILLTNVFYRIMFHHPLDRRLMPTLFILIAPPAVGFIAYTRLSGELDAFARVLYYAGLFLTLLLSTQTPRFLRLGFFLSSWAYSFPVAAIGIASLRMAELSGKAEFLWIGSAIVALLSALVAALLFHTLVGVYQRRFCVPDA